MSKDLADSVHVNRWECSSPRAIIHIIHGMSEHSSRYEHFAIALNKSNYSVYSSDLRGHGKTAGSIDNVGFFAEKDGWNLVVRDLIELSNEIKKEHPDLPLFILGHSMGSFFARNMAYRKPNLADGYILSGTLGHPGWKGVLGKPIARISGTLFGKRKRSKFLQNTSFAGFNKRVENKRTEKDWLTRNEAIVDQYINDPYCMQTFTNQFFYDLATGVLNINKIGNIEKVNKDSPVLLITGSMDPLGVYGKGPTEVYNKYLKVGVKDLEMEFIEGGRHEILNETNREEVYNLIIDWLDKRTNQRD